LYFSANFTEPHILCALAALRDKKNFTQSRNPPNGGRKGLEWDSLMPEKHSVKGIVFFCKFY
jgi:hypothetical protein